MAFFEITVKCGGKTDILRGYGDEPFLSLLRATRHGGRVLAYCGGAGTCRRCTVTVTGPVSPVGSNEIIQTSGDELLACRHRPAGDCTVELPDSSDIRVLTRGAVDIAPCGVGLGAAVDIGTTTVAVFLYDLTSGRLLSVKSGANAQRAFGADVISRISFCATDGGLDTLGRLIRSQVLDLIYSACDAAGRSREEIMKISVAGNTVMQHIFTALGPSGIGVAPFTPVSLFGASSDASDLLGSPAGRAELYMCPALAGYVGGDITAGLLSSGAASMYETCLFVDIGTNGEMAIGGADGFVCCATAAGPAFEGAEISCGMDAAAGAISRVMLADEEISYEVIGDAAPAGLCGSGLIDAMAVMLRCGAVDEGGRLLPPGDAPQSIRYRLSRDEKGGVQFHITDGVFISESDVRQLQLAKAAVRGGIETLLESGGLSYDDVSSVLIAGGFGAYIDIKSACDIGLIPPELFGKTVHAGNCAGAGAALALGEDARSQLSQLAVRCTYLELSSSALFMEKYIDHMIFDEFEEA